MSEKILEIRGLNKYFGPTHANVSIDFSLDKGEIRGLIGENGSGKSTLLSQIAGIYPPDTGEMFVAGEKYAPGNVIDAYDKRISMVLQELGVVGNLPVAVNVFLGRTKQFTKFGIVNTKAVNKACIEQFERWEIPMPPLNQHVGTMSIESRKMIELTRAMSIEPEILLLDEVTQSLSLNNRQILYNLLKKHKELGHSAIVITHDIEEMIEICDTITVLRDGAVVGNVNCSETSSDEIKRMMVGREVGGHYYREDHDVDYRDDVVLKVSDVSVKGELADINFEVHAGEILAFCGLSDSGIHSIGQAVYGLSKLSSGDVYLVPNDLHVKSPNAALKNNMGYVPKDRDSEALMINATIRENFSLPSLTELQGPIGYISPSSMAKLSNELVDKFSVKCENIMQRASSLSGGNKQKINLGRWLAKDLKLIILDCPTRGVDVGVKAYIYDLMREIKQQGIATILISDELTEALGMADRLLVMKDGQITKEIRRDEDFTEQAVIEVMI